METHYYVVALISQNASARCETHQAFLGGRRGGGGGGAGLGTPPTFLKERLHRCWSTLVSRGHPSHFGSRPILPRQPPIRRAHYSRAKAMI